MPVAFVSRERGGAFAAVATAPFRLGSDPGGDLVDPSPGVAAHHAELGRPKGEYILSGVDGHEVFVNRALVPMMALQHGDTVRLGREGRVWTFRNRMEGSFFPLAASHTAAWTAHPAFAEDAFGPDQWGPGSGIGGRDPARCRRVRRAGAADLVVKRLGPLRAVEDGDRYRLLLQVIGGTRVAGLARLLDGGLAPVDGVTQRWMATAWVEGTSARERIEAGGVPPWEAIRMLQPAAEGLARLHGRGLVHRDVAPGNLIVTGDGAGVLIDYGQTILGQDGAPPSRGVVGTPGYVAPEEVLAGGAAVAPAVDVFGLAAVGYALLTGAPPAQGEDVLATLAQAASPPPRPSALGLEVPEALETALLQGLSPDPRARPTAASFMAALAFAETQLGLGGVAQ